MDDFQVEQLARAFIRKVGITALPVDLSRYVAEVKGKVALEELEDDEQGYTMTTPKGPVITLNARDRAARRRFTQCHEIGHVVTGLPSRHDHGPEWSYRHRPPEEVACDVFAAELLLPYALFLAKAANKPLDFDTVNTLAFECFASREAVASRLVATSKLPCAYVLSERGKVRHAIRSAAMRAKFAHIPKGSLLPETSAAFALRTRQEGDGRATGPGDVWIDGWRDVELEEASIFLPDYDQTLTLLYCTDPDELDDLSTEPHDEEASNDPDDELLRPLDGHLRFR